MTGDPGLPGAVVAAIDDAGEKQRAQQEADDVEAARQSRPHQLQQEVGAQHAAHMDAVGKLQEDDDDDRVGDDFRSALDRQIQIARDNIDKDVEGQYEGPKCRNDHQRLADGFGDAVHPLEHGPALRRNANRRSGA